ncbi:dihydrodipicolinate synthase family protein [Sphingomonas corticis]|uniref:Dihydrodipicolinate synthase family protein n=1 Tax=Sphingomonas corticis TaxID=2722791 RepID=A0ABX1CVF2_9SPHN|nr:dihydrodipicolinate synthase family protein [Sphingomonas corticis]NJR80598.1 dihydrodipicolinate synthase family protein [Sphingomonas corticis]
MSRSPLRGVIAAIATPVGADGSPDVARLADHARDLFARGCDGLNLLGTTGEATSLGCEQRLAVMRGVADAGLPLERMMVGTGAAAVAEATALTLAAAELGFAGALVLPPFYYKPVLNEGVAAYVGELVEATATLALPIYLYNFPALSGVAYEPELVALLLRRFGDRIAGLKDSSGDLEYARAIAALSPALAVFPSNEATLAEARDGPFAGCISATANLNAEHCAAAYRDGDAEGLRRAVAIRSLFADLPLIPGIKALIARRRGDPAWQRPLPPLSPLEPAAAAELERRAAAI